MAWLVIACLGVTASGRDLLRSMISAWPGFAVLRDASSSWCSWLSPKPRDLFIPMGLP